MFIILLQAHPQHGLFKECTQNKNNTTNVSLHEGTRMGRPLKIVLSKFGEKSYNKYLSDLQVANIIAT